MALHGQPQAGALDVRHATLNLVGQASDPTGDAVAFTRMFDAHHGDYAVGAGDLAATAGFVTPAYKVSIHYCISSGMRNRVILEDRQGPAMTFLCSEGMQADRPEDGEDMRWGM